MLTHLLVLAVGVLCTLISSMVVFLGMALLGDREAAAPMAIAVALITGGLFIYADWSAGRQRRSGNT